MITKRTRSRFATRSAIGAFATLATVAVGSSGLVACGSKVQGGGNGSATGTPVRGQSVFISTSPGGRIGGGGGVAFGATTDGASAPAANAGSAATPASTSTSGSGASTTRTVEETDLYRVEGNRLYYLNSYRGLMIFDITNIDAPVLLGRHAIFGTPVDMVVTNGMASVIVGDWYGNLDDGSPFHGSIVRGLDATDPTNIKVTGEAKLGGWVQDSRLVGNILYTIAQDYGWEYGWYYAWGPGAYAASATAPTVTISAVNIQGGGATLTGQQAFPGSSAIFNVSTNAILLASAEQDSSSGYPEPNGLTQLQYVDISDPNGAIALDGAITIHTEVQGWGADNGRWNVDFDPTTGLARAFGCGNGVNPDGYWYGCDGTSYTLSIVDFSDKNNPKIDTELSIAGANWSPTARFDTGRMYLAPGDGYYYTGTDGTVTTPIQIFDTSNPKAPVLAGSTSVGGNVSLFMPEGNRLFALGNAVNYTGAGDPVTLSYLDVTSAAAPKLIGTSSFGTGWTSSEATNTFKVFTLDSTDGLVVLPFSGWNDVADQYNDGVQLIEFTPTSITTSGAGYTKGYVERGIFVSGRLISLSDLTLGVFDYSDHSNPKETAELTLARNVVDAHAQGTTIAELSSDWWGNDDTTSQMRVLPIGNAEEDTSAATSSAMIPGIDARQFRNGTLSYVVTDLQHNVPCSGSPGDPSYPTGETGTCTAWTQQVNVVDTTGGVATVRGTVALPDLGSHYYWNWWGGFYYDDWYDGDDVVQVGNDALAFRRWYPVYAGDGSYVESQQALFVVDLSNPDAPTIASTMITSDSTAWWGDLQAIGNTLYASHYEWVWKWDGSSGTYDKVKYYLDQIDLTDRSHPVIGAKINVPGILIGGSSTDPSILYTVDYRWDDSLGTSGDWYNTVNAVQVVGSTAYLQGTVAVSGYAGHVFVRGTTAYASVQSNASICETLSDGTSYCAPQIQLHQLDLTDPTKPTDQVSAPKYGWGWLMDVEGDRAIMQSDWGSDGIDIYKLTPGAEPVFDQFVRTRGWWTQAIDRQDNSLFLSSGYWGVQTITLD